MTERNTGIGQDDTVGGSAADSSGAPGTQPAPLAPDAAPLDAAAERPSVTAGTMLRQLRESAGVDAVLLASAMKVPLQKLQALEADRLDLLPDVTFARGLASAICRAFGADPAPVLERMPVSAPGLHASGQSINQPFRRIGDGPKSMLSSSLPKPLLIAVVVLLLGALALWLLPTLPIQLSAPAAVTGNGSVTDGVLSETLAPMPQAEPAPPAEMPEGAASAEQVAPTPVSLAPASVPASAPASAPARVRAAASSDAIVFTASDETWVTVRDAAGAALINRALNSGDVVGVSGAMPLSVTIGRKDAVTVTVHGKPFDHRSLSRTAVSRFSVNPL